MQVDYLIIGQGICGTMLSWFLHKKGKDFVVVDNEVDQTPSKIAAGVINPVTGRRYAITWKADEVIPFALQAYAGIGQELDGRFIEEKSIIDLFPSPQMRLAFMERMDRFEDYLHSYPDQNRFNQMFQYEFGCGAIRPAFTVHLASLMTLWRKKLIDKGSFFPGQVSEGSIEWEDDGLRYKDIQARRVLFCEGNTASFNPLFKMLPFSPNKGEALVIHCEGLDPSHIYKKGLLIVPMQEPATFWVGASYDWQFEDEQPTEAFYLKTTAQLNQWLRLPYKVLEHRAAVRPATVERRPFVGMHPHVPQAGILNGMGSKGTSLAPYFAHQLVEHLEHGASISPEADVQRFSRILSRTGSRNGL